MDATSKADGYIQVYNDIIKSNPLLTKAEESMLLKKVYSFKTGKQRQIAREKLFNSNVRFVLGQAYRYKTCSKIPVADLISAGSEGLAIAIDRFNPKKFNNRFGTYAVPWIKLKITRLVSSFESMVHIPPDTIYKSRKYKKILEHNIDDIITNKKLMKEMKVTEKVLKKIILSQSSHVISMDNPFLNSSEEEMSLHEVLPDTRAITPYDHIREQEKRAIVIREINKLKPMQKEILMLRYFGDQKKTLNNIRKNYGISRERVRQIEFIALRRLRNRLKNRESMQI